MLSICTRRSAASAIAIAGCIAATLAVFELRPAAQDEEALLTGQNIAPVYEGWQKNEDGSFNLVFGYFNRNWKEEIDLPVGAENTVEPGGDQGQPTHFFPRRNRFQFKIRVPADFGKKEVVWTLTSNGKTEKAYGTLIPDYFIDDIVIMNNNGAGGAGGGGYNINNNKPPTLSVSGEKTRTVKVGESVTLTAVATDDGIPKLRVVGRAPARTGEGAAAPRPTVKPVGPALPRIGSRCCPDSTSGLRVAWFAYRGPAANVTFDPPQFEVWEDYRDGQNSPWSDGWEPPPIPPNNQWVTHVTFTAPGTYVLRGQAHDGGLFDNQDITFVVK
jgi:hypothetical protein